MPANFDPVAAPYRTLEHLTLGRALERTREHHLPALASATHALVLGDGDGRFLAKLLAQNPALRATAVDTSAVMLSLLRTRCAAWRDRLETRQQDALTFQPQHPYDLVATHFFLDCLTQPEVERLAAKLAPALLPGGFWVVSDFRIPPAGFMRPLAWVVVRGLYLAFRILTGLHVDRLPDHGHALEQHGLRRIDQRLFLGGLLTTELWQR